MKPIKVDTRPKNTYAPCRGKIFHVFPTPIFHGQLDLNTIEVKKDIDILINEMQKRCPDDRKRNYTTYFDQDLQQKTHELPWYNSFATQLKDSYIEYITSQFECDVAHLTRQDIHLFAWLNRYDPDITHTTHDHVNSLVSGTYYVDMEEAQPIVFQGPAQTATFSHRTNNRPIEISEQLFAQGAPGTHNELHFHGRNGDFLLWPSYLLHSVDRSYDESQNYRRYGISFNLYHNILLNYNEHGDKLSYGFKEKQR